MTGNDGRYFWVADISISISTSLNIRSGIAKMNEYKLSEVTGINSSRVRDILRSKESPTVEELVKLTMALGCRLNIEITE